ncbi:hypothetical protein UUU_00350 [Klebsiella pneumoniae subsp. pneumoniae DSM 30104 = JCM 1662 = NBRC 14940]|nr:hypothetical protein UUU_00350 [Klebsiella pneumoniae subsp. pneumoniae DSM 30104 = JCM 1662 = NBRC 14940]
MKRQQLILRQTPLHFFFLLVQRRRRQKKLGQQQGFAAQPQAGTTPPQRCIATNFNKIAG